MAARTSEMSRPSFTDCPKCGQLCVEARILPCSHVLCRKCLRCLLQAGNDVVCPTCRRPVNSPSDLRGQLTLEQLPEDVVMGRLVVEMLAEESKCSVPHGPRSDHPPSSVCLDCGDVFCDSCSHVHRHSSATKSHTLKTLEPKKSGLVFVQPLPVMHSKSSFLLVQQFDRAISRWNQGIDAMKELLAHKEKNRRVLEAYKKHVASGWIRLDDVTLARCHHVNQECLSLAEADLGNLEQMRSRGKTSDADSASQDSSLSGSVKEEL